MNEREFWIVILEWAVCWLLQSLWLLFIYLCMQEAQKIWDGNTWNSGRGDGSRILSWIPSPVCSHLLGSTAAEVCILLSVSVYKWECCWVCLCTSENAVSRVYTVCTQVTHFSVTVELRHQAHPVVHRSLLPWQRREVAPSLDQQPQMLQCRHQ